MKSVVNFQIINLMSYKKWNEALLSYYFENENDQEVILYCDEEIINKIGSDGKIGNIEDFINVCLPNTNNEKITIYESFFGRTTTQINRRLNGSHDLKLAVTLYELEQKTKIELSYFNFIILSILKKGVSSDSKFHQQLFALQNPTGYDLLFEKISKIKTQFINRRIGKLIYDGLIKFQVVLNKREDDDLEKILFTNQFEFSDDETYETIINQSQIIERTQGSLRKKLIDSQTDECYKIWFESKLKKFKLNEYSNINNDIKINQKGFFVLAFDTSQDNMGLHLLTNVRVDKIINNEIFKIEPNNNDIKLNNDFYPQSIYVKGSGKIEIKEYSLKQENLTIESIEIKDIVFLQKCSGLLVQTENLQGHLLTYVLVKNNEKIKTAFEEWCSVNDFQINKIEISYTENYFSESYQLYTSENINKPYYTLKKEYYKFNYDYIQKNGGFKLNELNNTYLDVAPPFFKININDFKVENLAITITNNKKEKIDNILKYKIQDNIISIKINDEYIIEDRLTINIEFNYKSKKDFSKNFDFILTPSKIWGLQKEELYKYNSWGRDIKENTGALFNGLTIEGFEKIELNHRKIDIASKLFDQHYTNGEFFINLCSAEFYKEYKNGKIVDFSKLKKIYDLTLEFQNQNKTILHNAYSFSNLINNFLDLGYLQQKTITENGLLKQIYQPLPPTFIKLENSISNLSQCYLVTGLRTKKYTYFLKKICEENNVKIKFRSIDRNSLSYAEYSLLPDLIFVDYNFPFEKFKEICELHNIFEKKSDSIFIEDKFHLGNTILNFIESISNFEKFFLKKDNGEELDPINNLDVNLLLPSREKVFPRLRTQKFDEIYIKNKSFIELKENIFLEKDKNNEIFPLPWLNLHINYKLKNPLLIFQKKKENADNYIYYPYVYLYKYLKLPMIVRKALTIFNNGIAQEKKLFIKNSPFKGNSIQYPYNSFFRYNISSDDQRRNRLSEILTGAGIENNSQVLNTVVRDGNKKMDLLTLNRSNTSDNSSLFFHQYKEIITIKEGNEIIALLVLKNSKIINCFGSIKENKTTKYLKIQFDESIIRMQELIVPTNVNILISNILDDKMNELDIKLLSKVENIIINSQVYSSEKITIINN